MKITENVRSKTYPIEVDTSNESAVYVRTDIKESVEVDPVFNTESTVYTYTEIEYTWNEWFNSNMKKMETKVDSLINILITALVKNQDTINVKEDIDSLYKLIIK